MVEMKIGKFSPNVAKAGDDQAFWKRRGARAVPARLSSAALREFAQDPTLQVVEARGMNRRETPSCTIEATILMTARLRGTQLSREN